MRRTLLKAIALSLVATTCCAFPPTLNVQPEVVAAETPAEKPVAKPQTDILLFTASWCGPCQSLKAKLKRSGLMKHVIIMDCSDSGFFGDYARKYKFRGVPTLIVMVDGKEVARGNSGNAESLIKKYIR